MKKKMNPKLAAVNAAIQMRVTDTIHTFIEMPMGIEGVMKALASVIVSVVATRYAHEQGFEQQAAEKIAHDPEFRDLIANMVTDHIAAAMKEFRALEGINVNTVTPENFKTEALKTMEAGLGIAAEQDVPFGVRPLK